MLFWSISTIKGVVVCQLVTPTTKKVIPWDENVDECKSRGTNRCPDKNHWDRMLPTFWIRIIRTEVNL